MMQDEFLALIEDQLARAEADLRAKALPGSLTQKVLDGWLGPASRRATVYRRAREFALRWIIG